MRRGPIDASQHDPIHKEAPVFTDQSTEQEVLSTGIKVIDLIEPYPKGGKIGLFGGAGVGKTVVIMELINNIAKVCTRLACGTSSRRRCAHLGCRTRARSRPSELVTTRRASRPLTGSRWLLRLRRRWRAHP